MAITDKNLNFHESFKPELEYIAEILILAIEGFEGDKKEISKVTGMPSGEATGKVVPHIMYAKYMGLIEFEYEKKIYKLKATELGNIIFREDKYLRENLTKLILNYNLTDEKVGAPQWAFLFRKFDFTECFYKKTLKEALEKYFNKTVKETTLLKTYDETFDSLELMEIDKEKLYYKLQRPIMENVYVYAYTMLLGWERIFENRNEITFTDLINTICWGRPFGFDNDSVLEALELMEEMGLIKLNKILMPITIIRIKEIKDIQYDLYSMLL